MKMKRRPTRRDSLSKRREDSSVNEWKGPQPGDCRQGICGDEAACKRSGNSSHICLCPHDSSTPTEDLKCPNRLTVPLTPSAIHNIIPPSGGNSTTTTTAKSIYPLTTERVSQSQNTPDLKTISGVSSLALILILVFSGVCWWKRKSLKHAFCNKNQARKADPPRTGEPLLAERYIANPQYSSGFTVPTYPGGDYAIPMLMRDTLKFIEEIGEGCFGKVFKGELKMENNKIQTVAIKVLKDSAGRSAEDDFIREVNIMSSFRHENILTLIGVVQRENNSNPWMVFEFMPYGDLAGVLRSNSHVIRQPIPDLPPLDSMALLSIALQIARGMDYLASQHFVHRDLACRNCLVGKNLVVKIADFGMSRDVYTCDYYKMGSKRPMPIRWMSPESIMYARFTLESDVWSYGVVLWEIYSLGKQPFYGHNNNDASKLILQGIMLIPPEDCPTFICELMRACWRTDPKDRVKFQDICDKLQRVYDNNGWDSSGSPPMDANQCNWTRTIERKTIRKPVDTLGRLPRPPTQPISTIFSHPVTLDLTDQEGYLLPVEPPGVSDYLTALPD